MNKDRRKQIEEAGKTLAEALAKLEEAKEALDSIRDEEQSYYDNMPESFQDGEKGEAATAAILALGEVIDSIDNFVVEGLDDKLEEAAA